MPAINEEQSSYLENSSIEEQSTNGSDFMPQTPDKNDENRPNKKAEIHEKNLPAYTTQKSAELIALANFENKWEANTFFGGEYAKKVGAYSKRHYSETDLIEARIMCDMVILCEDRVESVDKAKDKEQEAAQEIELAENGIVIENSTTPPAEHFYVTSNLFTDHSNQIKTFHLNTKKENYLNPNKLNPYTVIQLPYSSAKYMPLFLKYVTFGLLDEGELELFDLEERRDYYLNIFWLKSIFINESHKKYNVMSNFEYWKKVGILWCPNKDCKHSTDTRKESAVTPAVPELTNPYSYLSEEEILEKEGTKWWDVVYNSDVLLKMQGDSELFIELSEAEKFQKNKRVRKTQKRKESTIKKGENKDIIIIEDKDEKERDEKTEEVVYYNNFYKSVLHHCTNPKILNFLTYRVNKKGPIKKSRHLAKLAEDVAYERIKIIDLKFNDIISEEDYEDFKKLVKIAENKKAKEENKLGNLQKQLDQEREISKNKIEKLMAERENDNNKIEKLMAERENDKNKIEESKAEHKINLEQERENFKNKIEKLKAEHKTEIENISKSYDYKMKVLSNNLKKAQVKSGNSGRAPAKRPFQEPHQRQPIPMMAQPAQQMMNQPQPVNHEIGMLREQMHFMQMKMNQMEQKMQGQQRQTGWSVFGH